MYTVGQITYNSIINNFVNVAIICFIFAVILGRHVAIRLPGIGCQIIDKTGSTGFFLCRCT